MIITLNFKFFSFKTGSPLSSFVLFNESYSHLPLFYFWSLAFMVPDPPKKNVGHRNVQNGRNSITTRKVSKVHSRPDTCSCGFSECLILIFQRFTSNPIILSNYLPRIFYAIFFCCSFVRKRWLLHNH